MKTLLLLLLGICASAAAADPVTFLVAFSGDSSRLVVASHSGRIRVLSVPDLKEIRSLDLESGRHLRSAAVSPRGKWLAGYGDGELRVWNVETGQAQPPVPLAQRSEPVYVFGADDDTLFVYQQRLRVWDVKQGRETGVVDGVTDVEMMTVSPDGRYLVAFGVCLSRRLNGNVCVCTTADRNIIAAGDWRDMLQPLVAINEFRPAQSVGLWSPADLVYTSDDRILLTLRDVRGPGFKSRFLQPADLRVVDQTTVEPELGWQYPGIRSAPAGEQLEVVSPDRKWKATGYQKRLYLYRITGETRRSLEKYIVIP